MVPVLVGFGRALRAAGLAVGPGDIETYCAAAATLDPTDLTDLYWTGRTTSVSRRDDLAAYDEVFHALLPRREAAGRRACCGSPRRCPPRPSRRSRCRSSTRPARTGTTSEQATMGFVASAADVLRHRAFADCTPDELRAVRRIAARLRLDPPRRRTRRYRPSARGRRPDLRRTVRDTLRLHGEPVPLREARAQGAAPPAGADPRRLRLDGRPFPGAAAVRVVGAARRRARWRCSASAPGSPASRRRCGVAARIARSPTPPSWCSTGTAAPGSGRRSTGSSARQAAAAWRAGEWW